jgi:hypothetical protein
MFPGASVFGSTSWVRAFLIGHGVHQLTQPQLLPRKQVLYTIIEHINTLFCPLWAADMKMGSARIVSALQMFYVRASFAAPAEHLQLPKQRCSQ